MELSGTRHVVVGAGAVGAGTALALAEAGAHVRLVSRSGRGPAHERVELVSLDATSGAELGPLCRSAAAIYNCANPPYHRWPLDWPPLADSLLAAAAATGAVLVTTGNLYAYGPVDGPLVESLPDAATGTKGRVRARMWAQARAAHRAGDVRAVEVRASDFVGRGPGDSHLGDRVLLPLLAGRTVRVVGATDQPHSWTYVPDLVRTLVTVARTPQAHGRVWHAPTNAPRTQREAVHDLCRAAGVAPVRVGVLPHVALRLGGLVSPALRELEETRYQFTAPYVLDSTAARTELGLDATAWEEVCRSTVERAAGTNRDTPTGDPTTSV